MMKRTAHLAQLSVLCLGVLVACATERREARGVLPVERRDEPEQANEPRQADEPAAFNKHGWGTYPPSPFASFPKISVDCPEPAEAAAPGSLGPCSATDLEGARLLREDARAQNQFTLDAFRTYRSDARPDGSSLFSGMEVWALLAAAWALREDSGRELLARRLGLPSDVNEATARVSREFQMLNDLSGLGYVFDLTLDTGGMSRIKRSKWPILRDVVRINLAPLPACAERAMPDPVRAREVPSESAVCFEFSGDRPGAEPTFAISARSAYRDNSFRRCGAATEGKFSVPGSPPRVVPKVKVDDTLLYGQANGLSALTFPLSLSNSAAGTIEMVAVFPSDGSALSREKLDAISPATIETLIASQSEAQVEVTLPLLDLDFHEAGRLEKVLTWAGVTHDVSAWGDFAGFRLPGWQETPLPTRLEVSSIHRLRLGYHLLSVLPKGEDICARPDAGPTTVHLELSQPFLLVVRVRETGLILQMAYVANP